MVANFILLIKFVKMGKKYQHHSLGCDFHFLNISPNISIFLLHMMYG